MKGFIIGMNPHWCKNEPSTVDIIGYCVLFKMNITKTVRSFNNRTDSDIVTEIMEANGLEVGEINNFIMELRISETDITKNHVKTIEDTDMKETLTNSMEDKHYT
jgi:hypothetical protein